MDNTPRDSEGNPIVPEVSPTVLDANKDNFANALDKQDFLGSVTEEDITAMAAGGDAGVKATLALMQRVARESAAQASANAVVIGKESKSQAVDAALDSTNKQLLVHNANMSIFKKNEILANPAYSPMITQLQQQAITKNPSIGAEELADLTVEFFALSAAPVVPTVQNPSPGVTPEASKSMEDFLTSLGA